MQITLSLASALSALLPIAVGYLNIDKRSKADHYMHYAVMLCLISDVVVSGLFYHGVNNNLVINIYILIYLIINGMAYYTYKGLKPRFKRAILYVGIVCVGFILIFNTVTASFYDINSYVMVCHSLYIVFLCLIYYWHSLFEVEDIDISRQSFFYYSTGLFIYHTTVFAIFLVYNVYKGIDLTALWNIKKVVYILLNVLLAAGFFVNFKTQGD